MKNKPLHATSLLAMSLGLAVAGFSLSAQAANFYWDPNGVSTSAAAATGTWGTSNFWSTDSTGATATVAQTIDNTSDVVFAAGSNSTGGTITVSGTQAAHSITFDDPVVFTLGGGTAINLGSATAGSGIFVTANAAQNVNTPVILNSAATAIAISNSGTGLLTVNTLTGAATTGTQTVTIGSSNTGGILVGGTIGNGAAGGNVALTINNTSTGVTTLQGNNSYTGGTTITAGTAALTNNSTGFGTGAVAIGASGTANITLTADGNIANVFTGTGTITVAGSTGTPSFTNASGLNGFTGTLNVNTTGAKKVTVGTAGEKIGSGATVNITSGGTLYLNTSTASNDGVTFNVVGSGNTENLGAIRIETNSVIGATSSVVLGGNTSLGSNNGTGTINAIISESTTSAVTKVGTGILVLGGANSYTGATTIGTSGSAASGGQITLNGANGAIASSSGTTIYGSGSKLTLDNATTINNNRIANNVTLSLGGELLLTGQGATGSATEAFGALGLGSGSSIVTVGGIGIGQLTTLSATSFARGSNFATALIRSTSLGTNASNSGRVLIDGANGTGLALVGTSQTSTGLGTGSTTSLQIVPYLIGDSSVAGTGSNFLTYDTTSGLRTLGASEQLAWTAGYTTAANPDNVKMSTAAGNTTTTLINASGITINSLTLLNTSTLSSTNSNALLVNSGAVALLTSSGTSTIGTGFSRLNLDNSEGVVTVLGTSVLEIATSVDVTSGGTHAATGALTKTGAGTLLLSATNLYTGATTINQGTLTVGNGTSGSLASGSGAVTVVGGATLALNQPTTSTFANDVANAGTFNITNNGTQTLSGNITGTGGGNFTTIGSGKTLILSGTANTYSNGTTISGSGTLQFNAGSTSGVSGASSANSTIFMTSGATLQLRGDNNATFNTGTITMNSDTSVGSDTTSFNFDVNAATSASNKTLTLGTLTFNTGTSGNRGNDVQTINVTGATGYALAITNAIGANSNGQVGQNYQYNVASGLTLSVGGGLNSGIGGSHIFQGAGNTIVGTLTRAANRAFNVFANQTGTVTFNNAAANGGGSSNYGTGLNSGTTVFNNVSAVAGVQINLGNQTALSTSDANFLLGGSTGLNGGLSFGSTVRPYDTTSGLLTIGGQNTSNTNTFTAGIQLGSSLNIGKSVNLVAAGGGQVDFTNVIANNGSDTTAGVTINGAYTVNAATVTPTGTVRLAGANTYRGTTTIAGGTLLADSANALNTTALGGNVTFTGGTLKLGSTFNAGANADISNRIKSSAGAVSIDTNSLTRTFASNIDSSNTGGLTKLNTGTLILTAANDFTGATTVSAGTLTLSNSLALQNSALDTTNSITGTSTDGLKTTETTLTMGGLTGNKDLASVFTTSSGGYSGVTALTLNPGVTNAYSGVIADGAAGMTLTKTGLGTQTLSGANTYTGTTNVENGTLAVGSSGSISDTLLLGKNGVSTGTLDVMAKTSGFSVANLSGNGSINATGTTFTATGNVGPGFSPGSIATTGDFTLAGSAATIMELAGSGGVAGTDFDFLSATGAFTYGGSLSIVGYGGYDINQAGTYDLFGFNSDAGGFAGGVSFGGSGLTETFSGSGIWTNSNVTFDEITGILQVVPEPNTWAMLFVGIGMLTLFRRRRA